MFDTLPPKLNLHIISFLNNRDSRMLACVSKNMYALINTTWDTRAQKIKDKISRHHPNVTPANLSLFAYAELGLIKHLKLSIAEGADVNAKLFFSDESNIFITPIHIAALYGHMECIVTLIEHGAVFKPETPVTCYLSPLHYAASGGQLKCIQYFLEHGVPVDQQSTICCPLGWNWTPLQMAASKGHVMCAQFLLQNGANVNFKDPDEYQAIHRAAHSGNVELLKLLLENGANPNAENEDGITPLCIAINRKFSACVKLLLQYNVNTKAPTFFHRLSPLDMAINNNDLISMEILLSHDASLVNSNLYTDSRRVLHRLSNPPLHRAADKGNLEAVKLLLRYGADTNIQSGHGETALGIAMDKGHTAIVEEIKSHQTQQDPIVSSTRKCFSCSVS